MSKVFIKKTPLEKGGYVLDYTYNNSVMVIGYGDTFEAAFDDFKIVYDGTVADGHIPFDNNIEFEIMP